MRLTIAALIAVASTSASTPLVYAQTQRDLDSHEHGHASLNIAVDGNMAFVELESPWNNLVGFEHAPSTDAQRTLVDEALSLLHKPNAIFTFEGTDCVVTETVLENGLAGVDGEHAEAAHADDEHDEAHDEKHAEDEHDEKHGEKDNDDDHAQGHDDHDNDHEEAATAHASVLASYGFECTDISSMRAVTVKLFELMPGFEELDVQLIGPGGQASMQLTAEKFRIDVKPIL